MRRVGYDCDIRNKMCVPQPGGRGTYVNLSDCQADCGPKCWRPEMSGPYIDAEGFWHPSRPIRGRPCVRRLVSYENIREKGPYHIPCMTRAECETAFHPVDAPLGAPARLRSSSGDCSSTCSGPGCCTCVDSNGDFPSCKVCKACWGYDATCSPTGDGRCRAVRLDKTSAPAANPCPSCGQAAAHFSNGSCYENVSDHSTKVCYGSTYDADLGGGCGPCGRQGPFEKCQDYGYFDTYPECKKAML